MRFVFYLMLLLCTTSIYGQGLFTVSGNFILRKQALDISDPGGYFVPDYYSQRVTYGLTASYRFTDRIALVSGINRIFFVKDENFWFKVSEDVLMSRRNPTTGIQIPVGLKYYFIDAESRFRWRLEAGLVAYYNSIPNQSGITSGFKQSVTTNTTISSESNFRVVTTNFFSWAPLINIGYRIGEKWWLRYCYEYQFSMVNEVLRQELDYVVDDGITIRNYEARVRADGSARLHYFGITFNF